MLRLAGLTRDDLAELQRRAARHSFASQNAMDGFLDVIDTWWDAPDPVDAIPEIDRTDASGYGTMDVRPTERRTYWRTGMPTYMDVHDIPGVKASDVAGAHEADVRVQGKYGVNYKQYWVDEENGKVFCLVDAPDPETATLVHREAHGLEAHTLYKVEQGA